MSDITIPPEAVEAAILRFAACRHMTLDASLIEAFKALIAAWPGMARDQMAHEASPKRIILPLPQEARDE